MHTPRFRRSFLFLSLLGLACSADSNGGGGGNCPPGQKCDAFGDDDSNVPATPCDGVIVDLAGHGLGQGKIAGRLGDALAKLAFTGDSCPMNMTDTVKKLLAAGCTGHQTMFVSETSQILKKADQYRGVTTMECDVDGKKSRVFISAFGIGAPPTSIPQDNEMIAFDPAAGQFDYYQGFGDQGIGFFGTSEDLLQGPGNGSGLTQERRCIKCHAGAGLLMKELAAPWVHWEGDFQTPGTQELVDGNKDLLGSLSNGIQLESLVREGHKAWNTTKVAHIKDGLGSVFTVEDLLRPLFCTEEINLDEASSTNVTSANLSGPITDPALGGFASLSFDFMKAYLPVITANGQRVEGLGGDFKDTIGGLITISRGAADVDYTQHLVDAQIIDKEFVEDVLLVDFTRAVFSDDRCGLLDFAPDIRSAADLKPGAIHDGFITQLEMQGASDGTPEGDLLRNLKDDNDDASATVSAFHKVCTGRTDEADAGGNKVPGSLVDYMQYISHTRSLARQLDVLEFPQTMPTDDLNTPDGLRLDPTTCTPTSKYVSVTPAQKSGG